MLPGLNTITSSTFRLKELLRKHQPVYRANNMTFNSLYSKKEKSTIKNVSFLITQSLQRWCSNDVEMKTRQVILQSCNVFVLFTRKYIFIFQRKVTSAHDFLTAVPVRRRTA